MGITKKLKETIAEYRESLQLAPERSNDILENVQKLAERSGLLQKKSEAEEETGDRGMNGETLDTLDELLYEYETSLVPDGLHTLENEELSGMMAALNGEYLPVAPAGDVLKNPDLLPGGLESCAV